MICSLRVLNAPLHLFHASSRLSVLPQSHLLGTPSRRHLASKTGDVWAPSALSTVTLTMYTKEGCSLCDDVVESLMALRFPASSSSPQQRPVTFNFRAVDITDRGNEELFEAYKYDIPVVHLNGKYWFKHRIPNSDLKRVGDAILRFGSSQIVDAVGVDPAKRNALKPKGT